MKRPYHITKNERDVLEILERGHPTRQLQARYWGGHSERVRAIEWDELAIAFPLPEEEFQEVISRLTLLGLIESGRDVPGFFERIRGAKEKFYFWISGLGQRILQEYERWSVGELLYTNNHEWIRRYGDHAIIGISEYVALNYEFIFEVDLPEVGQLFSRGSEVVKFEAEPLNAFDFPKGYREETVLMPVDGKITAVNNELLFDQKKIETDPEGEGWLIQVHLIDRTQLDSLMTEDAYREYLQQ